MSTLNYFVEANLCLAAFYLLFRLFLHRETNATFNRLYLLGALMLSVIAPLFHLVRLNDIPAVSHVIPAYLLPEFTVGLEASAEQTAAPALNLWSALVAIYLAVAALLFLRLAYRCWRLVWLIRGARPLVRTSNVKVLTVDDGPGMVFSVFRYIIIGDPAALSEREKNVIIKHESVHVQQGHTWDILAVELLCILFWFNPAIWAIKSRLRALHEYEADEKAAEGQDVQEYCGLLARIALQSQGLALVTHFSKSLTLKRIHMIKSVKHKISRWKIAALVPAVAGILAFVACQDQVMNDLNTVAQNSSVALDIPRQVQDRYDQLRQEKPDSRYVIMEIQPGHTSKLKEIEEEYGLPVSIEVYKFSEDLQSLADGPIKGSSDAGIVIVDKPESKKTETGRSFMILEYNETVQRAVGQMAPSPDGVHTIVDETAAPAEGMEKLWEFLANNISYPTEAREAGVTGRVFIEFIVEPDGRITNVRSLRGIGYGCDEEAVRVLALSPPWKPGTIDGTPVRQRMVLPIAFSL